MRHTKRWAGFLAVALGLWMSGSPASFAEDLDSLLSDREEEAGREGGPTAAPETGERQPGDREAPKEEPVAAKASGAPSSRVIEEIVVTAQRKEELLHDVPISMSVLDGNFLREQGVTDIQSVTRYVPNVRIDQTGGLIQPRIRGFATDALLTRGFEQPVGLTVDEIPYGRAEYFVSGLFDLDRVEVLRGPQGQLFGANTTVGLLNLTTKNPSDELSGFVNVGIGELEHRRAEAAVGGPLVPGFLNARVAGLTEERGGHTKNTTARLVPRADDVLGDREREAVRAKLDFPDLAGGSLLFSYQHDDVASGTVSQITDITDNFRAFFQQFDPDTDFQPNNYRTSIDDTGSLGVDIDTFVARGRYDLGDWGLHLVTGFSRLDFSLLLDDESPAPAALIEIDEVVKQTTGELRITSPDLAGFLGLGDLFGIPLGSTDFTVGFFYQRRGQDTTQILRLDGPLFAELLAVNANPLPLPDPDPGPRRSSVGYTENLFAIFDQKTQSFSGYGQANWRFLDRWTLLYGIRLNHTTKDIDLDQTIEPASAVLVRAIFGEFTGKDSRSAFEMAPKVGLQFDWTDDINFYLTWATNVQAGGFNNFSTPMDPNRRRYEAAHVRSWETGTKWRLFDGAANLNLGLFHMNMTDFQLNTNEEVGAGITVGTIINAGELRARGVEADLTWLTTDWLTLRAALGFNDTEFLDFPFGTCVTNRENTDGDDDPRCDLTGGPLPQAPKWDITVIPGLRVPLGWIPGFDGTPSDSLEQLVTDVDLLGSLTVQYTDTRFLSDTLDPRTRQPSFFLLDLNVGFGNVNRGWTLQLRVENLTDQATNSTAEEVALATGVIAKGTNSPRVMVGEFRWEF